MAIVYPIWRRPRDRPAPSRLLHGPARDLLEQREALLRALKDLDSDMAAGKIAEEPYRSQRDSLERQAALVLKGIDIQAEGIAEEIEAEVARARRTSTAGGTGEAPAGGTPAGSPTHRS